jgi:hypothetical protein
MTKEFKETEMSQRARKILEGLVENGEIPAESQWGREIKSRSTLKYNPELIPQFSNKKGLDTNKIYTKTIMPFDGEEVLLLKRCIEFNLTEEQAHEVIKERYRVCYKDWKNQESFLGGKTQTREFYPKFCNDLGIAPDSNFPDW